MFQTLKFSALTAAALVLTLVAIGAGAIVLSMLAMTGALTTMIFGSRIQGHATVPRQSVVIEGEYHEVPPGT